MARKISLIDHLFVRLSAVAAVGLVLLCGVWGTAELVEFNARSQEVRDNQRQTTRVFLKRLIDDVQATVAFERQRVEKRVEDSLRGRIDEAEAIAANLVETMKGRPRAEVEAAVRESLRPIRFNNGRGYYFAFGLDGRPQLQPLQPQREGGKPEPRSGSDGSSLVGDMLTLVNRQREGFYRYRWAQPGLPGLDHLKIAYLRRLDSLGWVIGTGEYVEDMEADIRVELLERIAHMRFDQDGYVFVSQWDGLSLVGALKGRNPLTEPHSPLRDGTLELIETAKAGGGVVTYAMTASDGALVQKTSYVIGIPEWQWFIGAGINDDHTEQDIASLRRQLLYGMVAKTLLAMIAALIIALVALMVMRTTARKASRDAGVLRAALARAADAPHPIDTAPLRFTEHDNFAEAANQLILRRQAVETQLLDRTAELEQTNADLERFAYIASHDLQEPLRTIGLFLQLLQRRAGDQLDGDAREFLEYAVDGAARMRSNIQGLLAYSRSSHHGDEMTETDLGALFEQVKRDLAGIVTAAGAVIETEPLPVLKVNPDQISALFQNLLGNAIRYRHPERPPHIQVSARAVAGGRWEFIVLDNGIGVPAEYRTAIFEPFRRFHPPELEGGSGIGLALCRRVVETHGGKIWVEEANPGSAFHFIITG